MAICALVLVFFLITSVLGQTADVTTPYIDPKAQIPLNSNCPRSACDSYPIRETVKKMWDVRQQTTPLVDKFRDAIVPLIDSSNTRELAMFTAQTLWAVDMLTNLSTDLHPSCAFSRLIASTVLFQQNDNPGTRRLLNRAMNRYGKLCDNAVHYSLYIGVTAASCPAEYPETEKYPIEGKNCTIANFAADYLRYPRSEIPKVLVPILSSMMNSKDSLDNAVATSIIGASTTPSLDFFEKLLSLDELLQVMRLKCCKVGIPSFCCRSRMIDLQNRVELLAYRVRSDINYFINLREV